MSSSSVESPFVPDNANRGKRPFNYGPFGSQGCARRLRQRVVEIGEPSSKPRRVTYAKQKGKAIDTSCGPAEAQLFFDNPHTMKKKISMPKKSKVNELRIGTEVKVEQRVVSIEGREEPHEKRSGRANEGGHAGQKKGKKPIMILSVNVRSTNAGDDGVDYTMTSENTFDFIYNNYAWRLDVNPDDIVLMKGRKLVQEDKTAEEANVKHGDQLKVYHVEKSFNTDTRFKEVVIRQCHNDPVKLQVRAPLNQSMEELHFIWARFMKWNPWVFDLVKNNVKVTRTGTIESKGVKNGDNFYCVPSEAEDEDFSESF